TLVDTTQREIAIQRWNIAFQAGNGLVFGAERVLVIGLAALLVRQRRIQRRHAGGLRRLCRPVHPARGQPDRPLERVQDAGLHAERVADIALTEPEAQLHGT
ncbi:hypothetical protein B1B_08799, partial [mine drainage metagenome]